MRLNKIKLAGFKSFVDPTAVNFPSNLIGVVGPNGCGKSNIIDAVRWVMGEISAKHLRGDSMADVVFNGSSSRKPVGTAAVQQTITATIDAIDMNVPSISFKGPRGWKYSTRVQDKKALSQVKVGDKVDITWTEALLVAVAAGK